MLFLSVLVFLAVSAGLIAAYVFIAPTRAEQRLREMTAGERPSEWTETVVKLAGPLARLSVPEGDWENSSLRVRFLNAGIRRDEARLVYFAAKTALPAAFAFVAYGFLTLLNVNDPITLAAWLLVVALIGCYLPNLVLWLARRSRQREIFETFPDAADLLMVCVEAGLGLDAGMTKVAEEMRRKSEALADELHLTNLEMRAGGTREQALRNLALRTGVEEITIFATMLTQADKFGTSIGESLRVFSDELRHKRQIMAEERAAKIPTKMLIPLVLFIFPSIILVILGPAVIQIIRTVVPMLTQ